MSGKVEDRHGRLAQIEQGKATHPVRLDLGCGERKFPETAVGIDLSDHACVDVVGDVFDVLARLPDSSVDQVFSSHFFEHLADVRRLLEECERVIKPGGEISVIVPHHSNPFFYSDPTHRTFFGLYTFAYYAESGIFRREVPRYSLVPGLQLVQARLIFKSYRPRYVRHGLKRLVQAVVNVSSFTQELYEELFCFWVPCSDLEVRLVVNKEW
jgi:ubiquinone/menaquinone biosynthesis C-methylase UbiE